MQYSRFVQLIFITCDTVPQKTYPVLPAAGYGQVQPYSLLPNSLKECQIIATIGGQEVTVQSALTNNFVQPLDLPVGEQRLEVTNSSSCPGLELGLSTTVTVTEGDSTSVIFWLGGVKQSQNLNRIEMPSAGKPYVKVLWSGGRENSGFTIIERE